MCTSGFKGLHTGNYSMACCQPTLLEQNLDRRGRLQVLRHLADGMVQHMLERADYQQAGVRAAGRELLASCVLRQLILFFTPHNANKACPALLLSSLATWTVIIYLQQCHFHCSTWSLHLTCLLWSLFSIYRTMDHWFATTQLFSSLNAAPSCARTHHSSGSKCHSAGHATKVDSAVGL